MSGTVKLIIEIPKDIYDGLINNKGVVIPSYWHEYVADLCKNGTSLDSVIAKIRAEQEKYSHPLEIEHAIEILDNIGKESEE